MRWESVREDQTVTDLAICTSRATKHEPPGCPDLIVNLQSSIPPTNPRRAEDVEHACDQAEQKSQEEAERR
jgi:hypothetical protein